MEKVIELNLGVGLNMFFPEPTKIVIEVEDEKTPENEEENPKD